MLVEVYTRFIETVMRGQVPEQRDIELLSDGLEVMRASLIDRDYHELVALLNDYA